VTTNLSRDAAVPEPVHRLADLRERQHVVDVDVEP